MFNVFNSRGMFLYKIVIFCWLLCEQSWCLLLQSSFPSNRGVLIRDWPIWQSVARKLGIYITSLVSDLLLLGRWVVGVRLCLCHEEVTCITWPKHHIYWNTVCYLYVGHDSEKHTIYIKKEIHQKWV